jgi:hypothetical protein
MFVGICTGHIVFFRSESIYQGELKRVSLSNLSEGLSRVASLIILITFIAHWIACFFFVVGDNELPNPQSWLVITGIDQADVNTKYI